MTVSQASSLKVRNGGLDPMPLGNLYVDIDMSQSNYDRVIFKYGSNGIPLSRRSWHLLTADPAQLIDDARRGISH